MWVEDVPGGTEEVPEDTVRFRGSEKAWVGELIPDRMVRERPGLQLLSGQNRESGRKEEERTWGLTSALTFSSTAATLWLWHLSKYIV